MEVVVVGGSASNVGKTMLAAHLIRDCAARARTVAVKVSVREAPCGTAVVTLQPGEEAEHRRDTGRLLDAGAHSVVWVTVSRGSVRSGLALGLATARRLRPSTIVVESTSAGIELRRIDDSWFVAGEGEWKPWADRHRRRADHVVGSKAVFATAWRVAGCSEQSTHRTDLIHTGGGGTMAGDQSSRSRKGGRSTRIWSGHFPLGHLAAAAALALIPAYATSPAQADEGSAIFASKCAACHTIGGGKKVGPDLKGITSTEDPNWLARWIASPSALIKAGDPTATRVVKQYPLQMPDLGLSSADVNAVLAYIAQQSSGAPGSGKSAAAPVPALPPGDAAVGREIFVGGVRLHNGGPPCMSCHSISGIGALGGGTLGPDLTDAYHKYGGEAGLAAFLTSVPTPTMSAVWSKTPLTPQEIANLAAFIKEGAVVERPLDAIAKLALLAVVGLVILAIILGTYWRRRLRGVRIPLVTRANMLFSRRYARRS